MTTAEQLREQAKQAQQDAQDSFDRCDTDGFLSQWASGITAEQLEKQAQIEENGGVWEFPALFHLDGTRVRAKLITTHPPYAHWVSQRAWALCDEKGKFIGKFITAFPKRETTMRAKGYKEGKENAPAKAEIKGSGYGLSGTAWAAIVRTDGGYPKDAK